MRVDVVGSGSWGTALAILLARNGHEVHLLGRDPEEIASLGAARENLRYLPGFALPRDVRPALLAEADAAADARVLAVPAGAVQSVVRDLPASAAPFVLAAKGLEPTTGRLLGDVVAEIAPGVPVGVLSGPNLAVEVARGIPTVALSAFAEEAVAIRFRDVFTASTFRVSHTTDVVGVELAGALKNVLAIGAGMSDGLGFGDNTKGALLSRGLLEMNRLGQAMGAHSETFLGPAGVGDLFATAVSRLSRNYRVGFAVGQGQSVTEALDSLGQVAEGVPTAEAVGVLARRHQVPMPVFEAVEAVLRARLSPASAVALLMERPR